MGYVMLALVLLLILGIASGRVVDSRDYADWRPSRDGFRDPP